MAQQYIFYDDIPFNAEYPTSNIQRQARLSEAFIAALDECLSYIQSQTPQFLQNLDDMRDASVQWFQSPHYMPVTDRNILCDMSGLARYLRSWYWPQLDLIKRVLIVSCGCVSLGAPFPSGWYRNICHQYTRDIVLSQGDTRAGRGFYDRMFDLTMETHQEYTLSIEDIYWV